MKDDDVPRTSQRPACRVTDMLVFILLLAATVCFVLKAFGVAKQIDTFALGFGFWAASFMVTAGQGL